MNAAITILLTVLEQLVGQLGSNSSLVTTIVNALIQLVPLVVKEAQDLIAPIKNIIAAVTDSGAADADQLAALKTLDAQCDAAFEAAAKGWET